MTEEEVCPPIEPAVLGEQALFRPISVCIGRQLGSRTRPFLFPAYHEEGYSGWVVFVSVRTPQWLEWVTKNGRTCGEIGVNAQLSGQPKRRKLLAWIWRTVRAHGCCHASEPWRRSMTGKITREEPQVIVLTGGLNAPPTRNDGLQHVPAKGGELEKRHIECAFYCDIKSS